jgi:hypothetical protein
MATLKDEKERGQNRFYHAAQIGLEPLRFNATTIELQAFSPWMKLFHKN